jgi:hypothetical protein
MAATPSPIPAAACNPPLSFPHRRHGRPMTHAIEVEALRTDDRSKTGMLVRALDGVSLAVPRGRIYACWDRIARASPSG